MSKKKVADKPASSHNPVKDGKDFTFDMGSLKNRKPTDFKQAPPKWITELKNHVNEHPPEYNMGFVPEAAGWIPPEDRSVESQKFHESYIWDTPNVAEIFTGAGSNAKRPRMWQVVKTAIDKGLVPDLFIRNGQFKNISQIIGSCFPAGTLVQMADGTEKPIEEVCVGDEVISHTGQSRRVVHTFNRNYTGDLITFKANGHPFKVSCTEDHKIATVPWDGYKFNLRSADMDRFQWQEAGDLTTDTRVLLGRLSIPEDDSVIIDITDYLTTDWDTTDNIRRGASRIHRRPRSAKTMLDRTEKEICEDLSGRITMNHCRYRNAVYNYVPMAYDLARLLGLYAAEGGVSKEVSRVTFTYSIQEEDLAEETLRLMKSCFGIDGYLIYNKERNTIKVRFDGFVIAQTISGLCPGNVWSKEVPPIIFRCGKDIRLAFIGGWLDGDGSRRRNGIAGVTVSEKLARGISTLANSCELTVTIRQRKAHKQSKAAFDVSFGGESALCVDSQSAVSTIENLSVKNHRFGTARRIKSITRTAVTNLTVYDFEVEEDHSFLANGIVVHNCVGFGAGNMLLWQSLLDAIIRNQPERILIPFVPYHYGRGRLHSGIRGKGSGSFGSGQAKALQQDGYLAFDMTTVPKVNMQATIYWTESIEYSWSDGARIGEEFITAAREHLVPTVVRVTNTDQAKQLADNFYTFTIASSWGGRMQCPIKEGVLLNSHSGTWNHQMWVLDYVEHPKLGTIWWIGNNWRYPHGKDTGGEWDGNTGAPEGGFYVLDKDMQWILSKQDSFGFADPQGFVDRSRAFDWLMGG